MAEKKKRAKIKLTPAQREKFEVVMHEFKLGKLRSSSGEIVTDKDQAIAIAFSEARKIKS